MIPIKIGVRSARVVNYDKQTSFERYLADLVLIDEIQEKGCIRMVTYQNKVAHYFNAKFQIKAFKVGDLILWKVEVS